MSSDQVSHGSGGFAPAPPDQSILLFWAGWPHNLIFPQMCTCWWFHYILETVLSPHSCLSPWVSSSSLEDFLAFESLVTNLTLTECFTFPYLPPLSASGLSWMLAQCWLTKLAIGGLQILSPVHLKHVPDRIKSKLLPAAYWVLPGQALSPSQTPYLTCLIFLTVSLICAPPHSHWTLPAYLSSGLWMGGTPLPGASFQTLPYYWFLHVIQCQLCRQDFPRSQHQVTPWMFAVVPLGCSSPWHFWTTLACLLICCLSIQATHH
jgi:hypothetical protein